MKKAAKNLREIKQEDILKAVVILIILVSVVISSLVSCTGSKVKTHNDLQHEHVYDSIYMFKPETGAPKPYTEEYKSERAKTILKRARKYKF